MMSPEELETNAIDLAEKLNGKADVETLKKELDKYLNVYGVGLEAARSGILKKYSTTVISTATSNSVTKKVGDLRGDEMNVTVVMKVRFCEVKTINVKGVNKTVVSGIGADETGSVPFTLWRNDITLEKDGTYVFSSAYTKSFKDKVQLNIGNRGRVTPSETEILTVSDATAGPASDPVVKKVADIKGDESNLTVTAKIITCEQRTINTKNGESKPIVSGIAGDDTGTIPFTIWREEEVETGTVYVFNSAYGKMYRDQPQLNIGDKGTLTRTDSDVKVAFNVTTVKIGDIGEDTKNANITGKVLSAETRAVVVNGENRTVWGGTIADDTGKIQYSAWNDPNFVVGQSYTISNAGIRSWRGIPQLNIGSLTEIAPSSTVFDVQQTSNDRTVEGITRTGGGLDISITGIIVDVRTGSGLIKRCPICKRAVKDGMCTVDGPVSNPVTDLRLKTIIDDGTGSISVIIGRADTERITGVTLADAEEDAKVNGDPSAISNIMASKVLLKRVTVTGNVMSDERFGPQMSARSLKEVSVDVKAEAERLYSEMEEAL